MTSDVKSIARNWASPASLMLLGIVPAIAGASRIIELGGSAPITDQNMRFALSPTPVMLHILAAVPYGLIGALQFAPSVRTNGWHRRLGPALALCGMIAAASGLWMAHSYAWPPNDGAAVYLMRLIVGTVMLLALFKGIASIQRRDVRSHEAWMTRAYALGMGAGTQTLTHLPWFMLLGMPGEWARAFLMGDAWVINILIAEYAIASSRPAFARSGAVGSWASTQRQAHAIE